jgi:hypothetical protein
MKHPRLLALILITLTVLLSNGSGNAARKDKTRIPNTQDITQRSQQTVLVPSPAFQAAILEALRAVVSEEVTRQRQEHTDYERWNTPSFWINASLVIVGLLYTVAAWRQLRATGAASEAAAKSARAAELALNAERPYVFVDSQQLAYSPQTPLSLGSFPLNLLVDANKPDTPPTEPPATMDIRVVFNVRNHGKGVALLKAVHTELILTRGIYDKTPRKLTRASKDRSQGLQTRILRPSQTLLYHTFGLDVPIDTWNEIKKLSAGLWVIGCVNYQDVFRRSHISWFCFEYHPPVDPVEAFGLPALSGLLMTGSEKYNRYI